MTTKRLQRVFVTIAALVALISGVSESAWARGDRGGAGLRGLHGGVLQELVFPCQAECRSSVRDCVEPIESEAVASIQSTCATPVSAAQTACAADRTATACKEAVSVLRTCGQAAITALQTGVATCRDTEESCREACDLVQ